MKRLFNTFLLLLFLPIYPTSAQVDELKESFLAAESYFLFEEYNEALPLYLKIHRADPDNDNINFKIGVCFLNDPYQKDKAIRYLEDACKNINPKYKENNFKETTAPIESFFYLGNAYLVNNNIDKALENYTHFREILDEKIYDAELVDEQIKICNTAKNLMKIPVDFDAHTLPPLVNTRFTDKNPIVSGNGQRLVFVSEQRFYDATFFSEKVNGVWQPPRNIVPELGVDGDVYPTYLSYDGTFMIIYRNDDFVGNLYQSEYIDGRWSNMEKMGGSVNTKYWESHGSLSADGNTLYFSSNRKGGYGGLDIYTAKKQKDGTWGEPVNLGETINTRYNEETPFITQNGEVLYFSSYGHYNMGGYDIFYSKKISDGVWDTPINMGYPINTTDNDLFFQPANNGANAYYSMVGEVTQGLHDIYYLDIYSDNNPRMYMITGFLDTENAKLSAKDNVGVYLISRSSGDTIDRTVPRYDLGNFTVRAPQGIYDLLVKSKAFKDIIYPVEITKDSNKDGITLENKLELENKAHEARVLTGEDNKIELEDTPFEAKVGEPLKIRMRLEKDATLYANIFNDSLQTAADTFYIDKKRFTYELIPEAGLNTIELELIDENGNISRRSIMLFAQGKEATAPRTTTNVVAPSVKADTAPSATKDSLSQLQSEITDLPDKITDGEHIYELLLQHSDGALKDYLKSLDPETVDISSAETLLRHLIEAADLGKFDPAELWQALANAIKSMDMETLGITSPEALKHYLSEHAAELGLSEEELGEILRALTSDDKPVTLEPDPGVNTCHFPTGWVIICGLLILGLGFWLILAWKRRREEDD